MDKNCIFCKISRKEILAKIIKENENAIAFLDVDPASDGHTLVIPKEHFKNLRETPNEVLSDMMALVKEVAELINTSPLKP
jgi:histidine triad (HIT) family protein